METFGRISKEMGFEERIEVKKMLNYIFTTCSVYVVCVCVCVCVCFAFVNVLQVCTLYDYDYYDFYQFFPRSQS
jgi:hypothetical protein